VQLGFNVSSIVLAGGKGLRIGRYKALVELDGKSLIQRVVSKLSFLNSEIIIVLAEGQQPPQVNGYTKLRIVADAYPGKGPLVGIYSGLLDSESYNNFVVACDMPFLNEHLIDYMFQVSDGFDVTIPRLGKMVEPLHAVYSKKCLEFIEKLFGEGSFKIDRLLNLVKVRYIETEEIESFDPEHLSFFNINTKEDLNMADGLINRDNGLSSRCYISDGICGEE
jgi:molybdopterin-guanine dinucleotide biosynthesis protein A